MRVLALLMVAVAAGLAVLYAARPSRVSVTKRIAVTVPFDGQLDSLKAYLRPATDRPLRTSFWRTHPCRELQSDSYRWLVIACFVKEALP